MERRFNRHDVYTVLELRSIYDACDSEQEFGDYLTRTSRCTRRQVAKVVKEFRTFRLQDELDHNQWLGVSAPINDDEYDERIAAITNSPYVPYLGFDEYIRPDIMSNPDVGAAVGDRLKGAITFRRMVAPLPPASNEIATDSMMRSVEGKSVEEGSKVAALKVGDKKESSTGKRDNKK